jgi:hypothetical protein
MAGDGERDYQRLGRYVRAYREAWGMRQEDLRSASAGPGEKGLSVATIRFIEGGHRVAPQPKSLRQLERGLHWTEGSADRVALGYEPWLAEAAAFGDALVGRRNDLADLDGEPGYRHRAKWCALKGLPTELVYDIERGQRPMVLAKDKRPCLPAAEAMVVEDAYQLAAGCVRRFFYGEITDLIPRTETPAGGGSPAAMAMLAANGPMAILAANGVQSATPFIAEIAGEMQDPQHPGLPTWRDGEKARWEALAKIDTPEEDLITMTAFWRMVAAAASLGTGPGTRAAEQGGGPGFAQTA